MVSSVSKRVYHINALLFFDTKTKCLSSPNPTESAEIYRRWLIFRSNLITDFNSLIQKTKPMASCHQIQLNVLMLIDENAYLLVFWKLILLNNETIKNTVCSTTEMVIDE